MLKDWREYWFSQHVFTALFSVLFTMAMLYANFTLPSIIGNALRKFFHDIYQRDTVSKGFRLLYQCAVIVEHMLLSSKPSYYWEVSAFPGLGSSMEAAL
ncbi:MAG: hypothetical protein ACO2OS_05020 [Thermosphaera aggregans]